jgi:hypothetical protein
LDGTEKHKSVYLGTDFLKVKPARNPSIRWKRTRKGVKIFTIKKRIELDKIGATVWEMCDGENTVEDIAQALYREYNLMTGEAEKSLSIYLEQLVEKGLIVLPAFEETQARAEEPSEKSPQAKMLPTSDGSVVFCGYCGTQNSRTSNYCLRCGQKLVK